MKQALLAASTLFIADSQFMTVAAKNHGHGKVDKCRVLSFRSGGVHGAFEAGALKALTEFMPESELHYDYIAGVSIGAVNASIFATFDFGKEREAADFIAAMFVERLS